jgi:hypothetical protein
VVQRSIQGEYTAFLVLSGVEMHFPSLTRRAEVKNAPSTTGNPFLRVAGEGGRLGKRHRFRYELMRLGPNSW